MENQEDSNTTWRCTAFSDGIPNSILENKHNHRFAHVHDHGIRFEPLTEWRDSQQIGLFLKRLSQSDISYSRERLIDMMFEEHRNYISNIANDELGEYQ